MVRSEGTSGSMVHGHRVLIILEVQSAVSGLYGGTLDQSRGGVEASVRQTGSRSLRIKCEELSLGRATLGGKKLWSKAELHMETQHIGDGEYARKSGWSQKEDGQWAPVDFACILRILSILQTNLYSAEHCIGCKRLEF